MPHFTYVMEKLKLSEGDAYNLAALISALHHPNGAYYYLQHLSLRGDAVEDSQTLWVPPFTPLDPPPADWKPGPLE